VGLLAANFGGINTSCDGSATIICLSQHSLRCSSLKAVSWSRDDVRSGAMEQEPCADVPCR